MEVIGLKAHGAVPEPGSVVIARVGGLALHFSCGFISGKEKLFYNQLPHRKKHFTLKLSGCDW